MGGGVNTNVVEKNRDMAKSTTPPPPNTIMEYFNRLQLGLRSTYLKRWQGFWPVPMFSHSFRIKLKVFLSDYFIVFSEAAKKVYF